MSAGAASQHRIGKHLGGPARDITSGTVVAILGAACVRQTGHQELPGLERRGTPHPNAIMVAIASAAMHTVAMP